LFPKENQVDSRRVKRSEIVSDPPAYCVTIVVVTTMYGNHAAFSSMTTPFSVKDILSWTEQQAHMNACLEYQQSGMNFPMSGTFPLDSPRVPDQMAMVGVGVGVGGVGGVGGIGGGNHVNPACLYGSASSPTPGLQPTYTNLSCSPPASVSLPMSVPLPPGSLTPGNMGKDPYEGVDVSPSQDIVPSATNPAGVCLKQETIEESKYMICVV
jgi:hypothetical protein